MKWKIWYVSHHLFLSLFCVSLRCLFVFLGVCCGFWFSLYTPYLVTERISPYIRRYSNLHALHLYCFCRLLFVYEITAGSLAFLLHFAPCVDHVMIAIVLFASPHVCVHATDAFCWLGQQHEPTMNTNIHKYTQNTHIWHWFWNPYNAFHSILGRELRHSRSCRKGKENLRVRSIHRMHPQYNSFEITENRLKT